jgi:hypothetical protein
MVWFVTYERWNDHLTIYCPYYEIIENESEINNRLNFYQTWNDCRNIKLYQAELIEKQPKGTSL